MSSLVATHAFTPMYHPATRDAYPIRRWASIDALTIGPCVRFGAEHGTQACVGVAIGPRGLWICVRLQWASTPQLPPGAHCCHTKRDVSCPSDLHAFGSGLAPISASGGTVCGPSCADSGQVATTVHSHLGQVTRTRWTGELVIIVYQI